MSTPLGGLPQLPFWLKGNEYRFTSQWGGWLSTAQNILTAVSTAGPTAQRPTSGQFQGMPYFDTTLGKPIWLKTPGAAPVWVDATGAPA